MSSKVLVKDNVLITPSADFLADVIIKEISVDKVVFQRDSSIFVLVPEYDSEMREVLSEEEQVNEDDLRCQMVCINHTYYYLEYLYNYQQSKLNRYVGALESVIKLLEPAEERTQTLEELVREIKTLG